MGADGVASALSAAFEAAEERSVAAADARLVIFSDHHKGTRDGADDFEGCEPAYCAALAWYLAEGYALYVLGDSEELWENDPEPVLAEKTGYPEVLRLEAQFHRSGRYERFFGNHDDLWAHKGAVAEHLHIFFPGLKVREALRLRLARPDGPDGVVLFAHGHQGTAESDRWGWLSRLVVRYVWRPIQRKSGYTGVTPSKDHGLRAKHDRAMAAWAGGHADKPILIAGHTHRPVFWDSTPDPDPDRGTVAESDDADHRADEEFARAQERNPRKAFTLPTPCYFNTGCCSFADGDVTGLEIADGEMRLVRWPSDDGTPRRKVLAHRSVAEILDAVAGRDPEAVTGHEVEL